MSLRATSLIFQINSPELLPPSPRLVLLAIAFCSFDDPDGGCSQKVSAKTIAQKTGLSYATTKRCIGFLVTNRFICLTKRQNRSTKASLSPRIRVDMEYLQQLVLAQKEHTDLQKELTMSHFDEPELQEELTMSHFDIEEPKELTMSHFDEEPVSEMAHHDHPPMQKRLTMSPPFHLSKNISQGNVVKLYTTHVREADFQPHQKSINSCQGTWDDNRRRLYEILHVLKKHAPTVIGLGSIKDDLAPHGFVLAESLEASFRKLIAGYYKAHKIGSFDELLDHIKDFAIYVEARKPYYVRNGACISLKSLCDKAEWFEEWMDQARAQKEAAVQQKKALPKPVTVVAAAPKADRTEQDVLQDIADLEDRIESMPEFLAAPSRNTMLPALKEELEGIRRKSKTNQEIERIREIPEKQERLQEIRNLMQNIQTQRFVN